MIEWERLEISELNLTMDKETASPNNHHKGKFHWIVGLESAVTERHFWLFSPCWLLKPLLPWSHSLCKAHSWRFQLSFIQVSPSWIFIHSHYYIPRNKKLKIFKCSSVYMTISNALAVPIRTYCIAQGILLHVMWQPRWEQRFEEDWVHVCVWLSPFTVHCSPKTITTLLIHCAPTQNNKMKTKLSMIK